MESARSSRFFFGYLQNKLTLSFIFFLAILFLSLLTPKLSLAFDDAEGSLESSSSISVGNTEENSLGANPDVPPTLNSFVQILMIESLSALSCQLAGYDPTRPSEKCLGVDPNTGKIGFVENGGGLLTVMGSMIDLTFTPPASSTQYVAYLQNNFGLVKSTYADNHDRINPCADNSRGVGFCSILPILDLWVAMRNVVYLILILIFIVIGVGIMLRIHIDPRTVMTVQNQIPKIIAAIIIISFSFAIAGFLIDVMWVTTYLFASVIGAATNTGPEMLEKIVIAANPVDAANAIHSSSGDGGVINIASSASRALGDIVQSAFDNQRTNMGILEGILHPLVSIIAFLIFIIAIIVALLRLWFSLVVTYVNLILDIVFAPFWILAGALPGSSLGLGGWFKDMLANLAVFPVAIMFFIMANYFVTAFSNNDNTGIIQNNMAPPLLGGTDSEAVAAIIGLGFILMLPSVLSTTKAFFKAPKVNFGPIMGPIGVGGGIVGGIPKRISGGVINEATRMRYDASGHPQEPKGVRRFVRIMRGGH